MSEGPRRRLLRPTAFQIGLLAGLGLCVMLGGAGYAAYRWMVGPTPAYDVQVASAGAALNRVGARQLEFRTTHGLVMRQVCNGACDDLGYQTNARDDGFRVAVLDAKGACIACENGPYVAGTPLVTSLIIREGAAPLVSAEYLTPQRDGSLKPASPPAH